MPGAIGSGAVGGAMVLAKLRATFSPKALVAGAAIGTALALGLFCVEREPWTALAARLLAGSCWIAAPSSLNVSAQYALPDWVRGRGLASYDTTFSGAMALGSALWGRRASSIGLSMTYFVAAACALLAIPLTRRQKL
ncbi:MAG: MFS transporter [Rhodocyclaceae bacterium]|nr:MFS transporter [Rhodocyclaceae bacterium]